MTSRGGVPTVKRLRYTYDYPRPAVTADSVLFAMRDEDLAVLLIQRGKPPFKGAWALPGGFVEPNEPLDRAAARELAEETGITGVPLEQIGAFGDPGRDPRGHTITVAFYSFIVAGSLLLKAGDDARQAAWYSLRTLPLPSWNGAPPDAPAKSGRGELRLAFDHATIIDTARMKLRERLVDPTRPSPFELVPEHFTLTELQRVHEAVLGRRVDRRTFRARLVARGIVEPVHQAKHAGRHRPTQLYRFKVARAV